MESPVDIKVVCLPSGQTADLQPLDRSVFGPVKKDWRRHLINISMGCFNGLPALARNTFPQHLIRLFEGCHFERTLPSGFRDTGICPFSADQILATVTAVNPLIAQQAIPDEFVSPKRQIRAQLTRMHESEADIDAIMQQVNVMASGLSSPHFAAASFQSSLIQSMPPKRVKNKKQSSFPSGVVLMESDFMRRLDVKDMEKSATEQTKKPRQKKTFVRTKCVSVAKKSPGSQKIKKSVDVPIMPGDDLSAM